jgi:acyl-CoA thioesterase
VDPVEVNPVARMRAADRVADALGMEVSECGDGRAEVRMRIGPTMVNGHALAHGGYVFLLADTAFAYACNSHGPVTVAAGARIDFVAPAYEGDVLVATASERTRFGRSGIYDVTVRRDSQGGKVGEVGEVGEVIAEFRGRSRALTA